MTGDGKKADIKAFWQRFQSGIEVAVAGDLPDKLLGVRDGFVRYFHHGLERSVPVSVTPRSVDEARTPLPISDADILALARDRALELRRHHGDAFAFCVGTEAGMLLFESAGEARYFVRSWTVVLALDEETWGSSGSVQLPQRLIQGLGQEDLPFAVPGTRRSGGMVSSLTGALETRRSATALATLHALSTLMYGRLESHPHRRRRRRYSG
jgi:non-canonical (house-cleaning) NTP pyrophosphatase